MEQTIERILRVTAVNESDVAVTLCGDSRPVSVRIILSSPDVDLDMRMPFEDAKDVRLGERFKIVVRKVG